MLAVAFLGLFLGLGIPAAGAAPIVVGHVIDAASDNPIVGATVSALRTDGSTAAEAVTVADGYYDLSLEPGAYTLRFAKSGFQTEYYDNAPTSDAAEPVTVSGEDALNGLDAKLLPDGYIGGVITDAASGQPVAGVTISHAYTELVAVEVQVPEQHFAVRQVWVDAGWGGFWQTEWYWETVYTTETRLSLEERVEQTTSAADGSYALASGGQSTVVLQIRDEGAPVRYLDATRSILVGGMTGAEDVALQRVPTGNAAPVADAGGPYSGTEGTYVQLDGATSADPDGDPLTYSWDFDGDGVEDSTETRPLHKWPDDFNGEVTLTVSDGDLSDTASAHVDIANTSPAAYVSAQGWGVPPYRKSVYWGEPIEERAYFWDAGALDTHGITWYWGDPVSTSHTASPGQWFTASHAFAAPGTYRPSMLVIDDDGGVAWQPTPGIVDVMRRETDLQMHGPLPRVRIGQSLDVTATLVDVLGNPVAGRAVDFTLNGSGQSAIGTTDADGEARVTLVVDVDPGFATVTAQFVGDSHYVGDVNWRSYQVNAPPTVESGGPYSGVEGSPIQFDGTASSDGDLDTLSYSWDFDGDGVEDAAGPVVYHAWADDYVGTVTLTVSDGVTQVSDTADVTIENVAPSVDELTVQPDRIVWGAPLAVEAAVSDVGADTHTYQWDFGDGTVLTGGASETHAYATPGLYQVTVTVADDDGGIATGSTSVTVERHRTALSLGPQCATSGQISDPVRLEANLVDLDALGPEQTGAPSAEVGFALRQGPLTPPFVFATTDSDGNAGLSTTMWHSAGMWQFSAEFYGSPLYDGSYTVPIQFPVERERMIITYLGDHSCQRGGTATFRAMLCEDDPTPAAGRYVEFKIGDGTTTRTVGTAQTNGDGVAELTAVVDEPGTHYLVEASFPDRDRFFASATSEAEPFTVLSEGQAVVDPTDPDPVQIGPVEFEFPPDAAPGIVEVTPVQPQDQAGPPSGFRVGPNQYYEITLDPPYTGSQGITVTLTYADLGNDARERQLKLYHRSSAGWEDITLPVAGNPDTVNNTITGVAMSFSDFAVFELDTTAPDAKIQHPLDLSVYPAGEMTFEFSGADDEGGAGIASCLGSLDGGPPFASGTTSSLGAGVYTLKVTATDNAGNTATEEIMFVVYDPSAGFVTGGGWIASPAGAYTADPALEGKATFGFVSRYKKGATVPDGSTEFQFHAAGMNFHSNTQQWLVVNQSGRNAQFKCTGTIDGEFGPGSDPFDGMIWAGDGNGPEGQDTFRIKLWYTAADGSEVVVYDNLMSQPVGGGSIVVQTK